MNNLFEKININILSYKLLKYYLIVEGVIFNGILKNIVKIIVSYLSKLFLVNWII